jgi:exodeoxyribonuclease V alpha subunit
MFAPRSTSGVSARNRDRVFRVGDKVIQRRNNYNKDKAGIFNGTVGTGTDLSLQ